MRSRRCDDAGQAFPIYITVVAGLLFLAFAYLAVGQAAVNRNGAQTAADAAALAAALNARNQLADKWLADVLDPSKWQEDLEGKASIDDPCWRAVELAAHNDAQGLCNLGPWPLSYEVNAKANKPVGDSVVPGTESKFSTAHAIAVIEPLCHFKLPSDDTEGDVLPRLTCGEGNAEKHWDLDPDHLTDLPKPEDLFDVHLADSPANND